MVTSEYRGLMGAGFPQGYPGSFGPLIRYGSPDGFTGGVTAPGMNTQAYYQPPNPLGVPGGEEDEYANSGYIGKSWDEIRDNRDALRKNPYGDLSEKDGGQRTYAEWARQGGMDVADPNSLNDFLKLLAGHRGPWNPNGTENPYHKKQYPWLGGALRNITKGMTRPEKARYRQSRFVYDNGLRGGLSDTNTYENKRNMEAANPGSSADLKPWQGGTWERDKLLEVPEVFGKNIGGV